jgi:outer membrane protein assembly factor BamB
MPAREQATRILKTDGVKGGLVVHLGCGDGKLTAALRVSDRFLLHGLDTDAANVAKARAHIRSLGLSGPVSVDVFEGNRLPYVNNLVNVLVAEAPVRATEAMRVLAPGGVLLTRNGDSWSRTMKPRPEEMDEWTHYLHGAGNNAVSTDQLAGPPRHLQWTGPPLWPRSHEYSPSVSAMVSTDNKLFYLMDDGIRGIIDQRLPERWSLYARDAFNGMLLWKVAVPGWGPKEWKHTRHWHTPLSLPRRLVVSGERVYVTLGYRAPVSVLDVDTGKLLVTFTETGNAEELLLTGDRLIVRRRKTVPDYPPGAEAWNIHVRAKTGKKTPESWRRLPAAEESDQAVMTLDAQTGEVLWAVKCTRMMTLSLAASEKHVCYHDFDSVVCLNLENGKELWRGKSESWPDLIGTAGTLVMHDGLVFYTAERAMFAWDAATGKQLWAGPRIARTTIRHPADMFIANGLVWGGLTPDMATGRIPHEESPHVGTPLGGQLVQGLDPKTGKMKRELEIQNLISPGHHVRCYRAKATNRFLLWPKRGVEFVDIVKGTEHERCNWFRGECSYGVIPANGLVYAPPHPCQCNLGVVLTGFNALAAKRPAPAAPEGPRLIQGPAYGDVPTTKDRAAGDWPMYRHDAARSGRTTWPVSGSLNESWAAKIGGRLTAPVVAGGKVYLASIDQHTVYALNAANGRIRWQYTAGGRVDSPPSIHKGRVTFGCRDGWVYCLRSTDGMLAWRFRAAPYEQRIMAFEQLESPWPVSGSVLVLQDKIYFAAGRSSFLDGGVHLYALSAITGKVLHYHLFDGPWADISKEAGPTYHMEGTKADLLSSDGKSIFLLFQRFDLELNRQPTPRGDAKGNRRVQRHLMPRNGFLDTTWFDRNSWAHGESWFGRHFNAGTPGTGQILSFDETTTYSLQVFSKQYFMSPHFVPGTGYLLRADVRGKKGKPRFSVRIPVRARGMVMAGKTLFLAGVPDTPGGEEFYQALEGPAQLWAVSTKDGSNMGQAELDAPPVPDGMATAAGRIFVCTTDGRVICSVSESP